MGFGHFLVALSLFGGLVNFGVSVHISHISKFIGGKKLKTRHVVDVAYGTLEYYYQKSKKGEIDEITAKRGYSSY